MTIQRTAMAHARAVLLTLAGLLSLPSFAVTPAQRADLNHRVDSLVEILSDGIAVSYPQTRRIQSGRIYGANKDDAVVLFSIEGFDGGNTFRQYLTVFAAVEGGPVRGHVPHEYRLVTLQRVGGSGWRALDLQSIVLGTNSVRLAGKAWMPNDANCCPSKPVQAAFLLNDNEVIEERK